MSLVRSLALLAEYHCGIGERDTGYMYMGASVGFYLVVPVVGLLIVVGAGMSIRAARAREHFSSRLLEMSSLGLLA